MQALVIKISAQWDLQEKGLIYNRNKEQSYDDLDFERDVETLLRFLEKQYAKHLTLIICLDEIDATLAFPPEIHQRLRSIFQNYQGKIRMLAAGISIKKGNWALPTSPWYNFFEIIEIPPLDREHAVALITKPVKGFYSYEKQAIDFILEKTENKPYYIQSICKKVINKILNEKRSKVALADVKSIYRNMLILDFNQEFEIFWEHLSVDLQKAIANTLEVKKTKISKKNEIALRENLYNQHHKVITIQDGYLKLNTIFSDWLENQYFVRA